MQVDVDSGKLEVTIAGRQSRGSPLLLLHGWSLDHRIFEPQIRSLERSFFVIACDRRGFGRSQAPPDLGRELDDLDRVLRSLGLETVHLLGMSQGARIALRYAVTKPGRMRSLILQAPVIDGIVLDEPESERLPMEEFRTLARAGRIDEVRRRWLAHPMLALGQGRTRLRSLLADIVADYEGKDLMDDSPGHDGFTHDLLPALAELDKPCLILTGAHDTVARREHARRLLASMRNAREIVFRNGGHLSNLTEARAYNRYVARFCASVDASNRSLRN